MDLLDSILAGIDATYDAKKGKKKEKKTESSSSSTSSHGGQRRGQEVMSRFQQQMRRRALLQMNRFKVMIRKTLNKFKESEQDSRKEFPNESDTQRRFVLDEVVAEFGYISRTEEKESGTTVIAVYKDTPPPEENDGKLTEFQKAELNRKISMASKKKKKKVSGQSEALSKAKAIAMPEYRPKDRRSAMQMLKDARDKVK
mmetsp:Transcript_16249/g.24490  ORF Transcript_16249/g.24490 Transcript_16249/m.24490 type:complete len:200 (-) Transcript_16249:115-714(-)